MSRFSTKHPIIILKTSFGYPGNMSSVFFRGFGNILLIPKRYFWPHFFFFYLFVCSDVNFFFFFWEGGGYTRYMQVLVRTRVCGWGNVSCYNMQQERRIMKTKQKKTNSDFHVTNDDRDPERSVWKTGLHSDKLEQWKENEKGNEFSWWLSWETIWHDMLSVDFDFLAVFSESGKES